MNNYSKHSKQDLENMKWLDLVAGNKESLHQRLIEIWQDSIGQPQVTATGKIDLNFNEILQLRPEDEFFHKQVFKHNNLHELHKGMEDNNMIGRHDFEQGHPLYQKLEEKFGIHKCQGTLNLQRPANVVGIHLDRYRQYMMEGPYDYRDTLTKEIFRGVIFCQDWHIGQVFMCGTESLTHWKQGDTYTFPWYMPHGSANAGGTDRYLIRFIGELTKK
tara:strand:+ start:66 stop:716 length:651 start_codon:yes stop_codon:yes gene_type:complete